LGHLICLFTLIINIYGLGVGISTIKKFTSGRGVGYLQVGYELGILSRAGNLYKIKFPDILCSVRS